MRTVSGIFSLACFLIALCSPALAETKTIVSEATYLMGDGETPVLAESRVLQKAKQTALEQAGTYVESYTKVRNLDLTNEEIQTIAGGVLAVEILEQSRRLVGDGLQFSVKIKTTVTSDKMEELAQRIKGRNVAEQYNKLQNEYARLTAELERWKQEAALAKDGKRLDAALGEIRENERKYGELQQSENALLQRLVSGSDLIIKAEELRISIDGLIEGIRTRGIRVEVGTPVSRLTGTRLDMVAIGVPLKVTFDEAVISEIRARANSLGGEVVQEDSYLLLRIAKDGALSRYFVARITSIAVTVTLQFSNGLSVSCIAALPFRESLVNPVSGVVRLNRRSDLTAIFELQQEKVLQLTRASATTAEVTNRNTTCKFG